MGPCVVSPEAGAYLPFSGNQPIGHAKSTGKSLLTILSQPGSLLSHLANLLIALMCSPNMEAVLVRL